MKLRPKRNRKKKKIHEIKSGSLKPTTFQLDLRGKKDSKSEIKDTTTDTTEI